MYKVLGPEHLASQTDSNVLVNIFLVCYKNIVTLAMDSQRLSSVL